MKIKHWQGYGSVTAKKVSKTTGKNEYDRKYTKLVVEVKGMHEWGLEMKDPYGVFHWLVKRFDKTAVDYFAYSEVNVKTEDDYVREGGLDIEVCKYTITYIEKY